MYNPPISNKPSVPAAEFEHGGKEQLREVDNFVQADQQLLADLLAGKGKTEEIEIAKIKCDGELLIRDSHDEDKIRELVAKIQNGVELAAIIVARAKNGEFLLVDGNQRLIARLKCNLTHVTAFVVSGDISDAIRLRRLANASHGVPLNRNEKRLNARRILLNESWWCWSDKIIAFYCNVSDRLVGTIRSEILNDPDLASANYSQITTRLVLRRGKIYEMRVADINANRNSGKKSNQKTNAGAGIKDSHKAAKINEEFDVKPGDVFLFFNENQPFPSIIYNGDCRDERFLEIIARFIKFGLLIIDLPYNVNYTAGGHFKAATCHALDKIANDNLPPEEYDAFVDNALAFASPYLIPRSGYFVWCGMEYTATVKALCEQRLGKVSDEIIRIKKGLKQSRSYFKKGYEKALFGWTGRDGLRCWLGGNDTTNVFDQRLLGKSQHDPIDPDQSGMSAVEIEDYELARSIHPCPKPVPIYKKMIELSLEPGGAVIDSMAGSDTTMVAAQLAGRRGFGIELQSEYAAVAVNRMKIR